MKFRPMLAASFDNPQDIQPELQFLTYPLLASPKIDGIRWMKDPDSGVMSRSWKQLPNRKLQEWLSLPAFNYLDGEVVVGEDPAAPGLFNKTQSAIMTRDDTQPFSIWVFDDYGASNDRFDNRTSSAQRRVDYLRSGGCLWVNYVEHHWLKTPEEVLQYEQEALEAGYEGIMLRSPSGAYKFGRSTLKQQGLIKIKRFIDDEAKIVGFEELERNQNEQTRNAFGLAKRGHSKAGKVAGGTLGKFIVEHPKWGRFSCGSGLDDTIRAEVWANQDAYLGRTITYKFQPHGTLEKPRTPIFKGFRPEVD